MGVPYMQRIRFFHLSAFERLLPALKVQGDYLIQLIFPLNLSADYSIMPKDFFQTLYSTGGLISLLFLGFFVFLLWVFRKKRQVCLGLWLPLSFSLTANIFTPIGTLMGDRLAFTPSIGFIPFCCWVIYLQLKKIVKDPQTRLTLLISLLLPLALLSLNRIPVWKDNASLFSQTLTDAPLSPKAKYNWAVYLFNEKKDANGAKSYLKQALTIHPQHKFTLRLLADIALQEKSYGELEYYYKRILEVEPPRGKMSKAVLRSCSHLSSRS